MIIYAVRTIRTNCGVFRALRNVACFYLLAGSGFMGKCLSIMIHPIKIDTKK